MNHYCTYFDRNFLIQGLALWRSLASHDPDAVLWVLTLDEFTATALRQVGGTWLKVVPLTTLEADDPQLTATQSHRSRVEYYFTISPCWPRWLLRRHPEIERVIYLDADLFFFADPAPIFAAMEQAQASVLITPHRFPPWLAHCEKHGIYNVGILVFRNDDTGRACLEDWRTQCLEWCYDRLDGSRYADQKYLEAWPTRWGPAVLVLDHPGVNLAPWNWTRHRLEYTSDNAVTVDGQPLIIYHFAGFRVSRGRRWFQSGQLDYGVMGRRLRRTLYISYWRALCAARAEIQAVDPEFDFPARWKRGGRAFWRSAPLRLLFGGNWYLAGDHFHNFRGGLGRWSGNFLGLLRRVSRASRRASD